MRRSWILGSSLFVLAATRAPSASANGRFPASSAIVFDAHDSKTAYVRATFGLLATHDGGDSWRWICERAIGVSGIEDPTYVVTPMGTLVGNTTSGVAVSRDGGCSFTFAGGPGAHVLADLAMRPDGEIVGVSSVPSKMGALFDDHLVVSKDDAQTFAVSGGPIDPTLSIQTVEIAPSDPARLYLSAVRGEGEKRTATVLVSYDAGLSWAERKLELLQGELAPFVARVDLHNPDRVYVRTSGDVGARTRLLVTDDAGKTWRKIFDASTPLLGFALSEDGSQVFAGAPDGVSFAPTTTFAFSKGSSAEAHCLGLSGNRFWICSTEKSGFLVGASKNGGRSFDAKLRLEDIKGALECGGDAGAGADQPSRGAQQCADAWPKQRRDLGLPEPGEAVRVRDPGAPTLRGRGVRTPGTRRNLRAIAGIALLGMGAYYALQRLRRRRR